MLAKGDPCKFSDRLIDSDKERLVEGLLGGLLVGHENGSTGNRDSAEGEVAVGEGAGSLDLGELDGGSAVGAEGSSVKGDVVEDVVDSPLEGLFVGGLTFLEVLFDGSGKLLVGEFSCGEVLFDGGVESLVKSSVNLFARFGPCAELGKIKSDLESSRGGEFLQGSVVLVTLSGPLVVGELLLRLVDNPLILLVVVVVDGLLIDIRPF